MKTSLSQVLACVLALTSFSLIGCSSNDAGNPTGASGGSQGGAVTASGGVGSGGAGGATTSSGGATSNGGTLASGGQEQGGSISQGGAASGGTSTGGQPVTGGISSGGRASGGAASGGSATGGGVAGGSATGGGATGGKTSTGGAATGGTATGGLSSGGEATGGRTSTGGAATGGAATGGVSAGGAATGGKTTTGGTTSGGATATGGSSIGGSSGKITVWMSGDSTMQGDTIDTTACASCPCGWGAQFSTVFNSNVTVIDRAVSGTSIKSWLYKNVSTTADANGECVLTNTDYSANWNAMLDANTGMKPGDYLIIEFGINDGSDCSKARHVGIDLFKTYLTDMAKAASDRGAQALFLTPTNAIMCTGATANTNTRGQYPAATIAAGTADNVPVIDVTTLSAALYTSEGLCPNSSDYTSTTSKVGQFFCGDHTHFEKAGALKISQMVGKALKDRGIGLASYLIN